MLAHPTIVVFGNINDLLCFITLISLITAGISWNTCKYCFVNLISLPFFYYTDSVKSLMCFINPSVCHNHLAVFIGWQTNFQLSYTSSKLFCPKTYSLQFWQFKFYSFQGIFLDHRAGFSASVSGCQLWISAQRWGVRARKDEVSIFKKLCRWMVLQKSHCRCPVFSIKVSHVCKARSLTFY